MWFILTKVPHNKIEYNANNNMCAQPAANATIYYFQILHNSKFVLDLTFGM